MYVECANGNTAAGQIGCTDIGAGLQISEGVQIILAAVQISGRIYRYLRGLQKYFSGCTDIRADMQISEVPTELF